MNTEKHPEKYSFSTDFVFFILSWLILGGLLVVGILQDTGTLDLLETVYPCFFLNTTGYYCPGCGGTHAVVSLVSGHPIDSFLDHPFVIYVTVCALICAIGGTITRIRYKKYLRFCMLYVYIGIAILLIQWIVKNLFFR